MITQEEIVSKINKWSNSESNFHNNFGSMIHITSFKETYFLQLDLEVMLLKRTIKNVTSPDKTYTLDSNYNDNPFDYNYQLPSEYKKGTSKNNIMFGTIKTNQCNPKVKCNFCGGDGICKDCNGHGKLVCGKCGGRGVCTRCNGNGATWEPGNTSTNMKSYQQKCYSCGGSGSCSNCGGKGKVTCGCDSGKCKKCNGTGKLVCPKCNGTGFFQEYQVFDSEFIIEKKQLSTYSGNYKMDNFSNKLKSNFQKNYEVIYDSKNTIVKDDTNYFSFNDNNLSKHQESLKEKFLAFLTDFTKNNDKDNKKIAKLKININEYFFIEVNYQFDGKEYSIAIYDNDKIHANNLPSYAGKHFTKFISDIFSFKTKNHCKKNNILLAKIIYVFINADGIADDKEMNIFNKYIDSLSLSNKDKNDLLNECNANLKIEDLTLKLLKLEQNQKETILAFAWHIIISDDKIDDSEINFFKKLQSILKINDSEIDKIKKNAEGYNRVFKIDSSSLTMYHDYISEVSIFFRYMIMLFLLGIGISIIFHLNRNNPSIKPIYDNVYSQLSSYINIEQINNLKSLYQLKDNHNIWYWRIIKFIVIFFNLFCLLCFFMGFAQLADKNNKKKSAAFGAMIIYLIILGLSIWGLVNI